MMIQKKVVKSGTGLVIGIPKPIAELMELSAGTDVEMDYEDHKIIISKLKMEAL